MAIIKQIARLLPTPPPHNIPVSLQDWLREAFDNLTEAMNNTIDAQEINQALLQNGGLDGIDHSIVVPASPGFVALTDYNQGAIDSHFISDTVLGTITLPPWPGWVELTVFISMKQTTAQRGFSVVAHLEANGIVDTHASGTAYVPTQEDGTSLTLHSTQALQVVGGEVVRIMLQVEDLAAANATFDLLNCTIQIDYISIVEGTKLFN